MTPVFTRILTGAAALVVAQSLISSAGASTIADESFLTGSTPSAGQYTTGALGSQNPTVAGFTGSWLVTTGATVQSSSLTTSYSSTDYDTPTGGSLAVATGRRIYRLFDSSVTSLTSTASTGTVYLSFIATFGGSGSSFYSALELGQGTDATKALAVGMVGSTGLGIQVNNAGTSNFIINPSPTVVANQNYTFLLRIDFSSVAASDSVTLWVDPILGGAGDPTGVSIAATGLDLRGIDRLQFGNFSGSSSTFDELRIGTSLQDVTAIPEPSTYAALAGALTLGTAFIRRRRSSAKSVIG